MILLDTHMWVWWVQGDSRLSPSELEAMDKHARQGYGVSVISCWEVAMLHSLGRVEFSCSLDEWLDLALSYPGVEFVELSRSIVVDSCRLPGSIHRDPADRMLIATARENSCPLLTADGKILNYEHLDAIHPSKLK